MATSTGSDETARLVERLKTVRKAHESDPPEALRDALRQAIREAVGGLQRDEAGRRLDQVKAHLVGEARRREERAEWLEAEVRRLKSDVESLRAERDRLAADNTELRAAPVGAASGAPGGVEVLGKMREGLRQRAIGNEATPEALGLPASEAGFFSLTKELLGFALTVERAVLDLRSGLGMVPGDSRIIRKLKEQIPGRFRACLDNETGAIPALQESLAGNSRFLYVLNEAYLGAVRKGVPEVLKRLDPQPLREKYLEKFMKNYEGAWEELTTIHDDLSGLPPKDVWDLFFHRPFLEKLGEWEGPGASR